MRETCTDCLLPGKVRSSGGERERERESEGMAHILCHLHLTSSPFIIITIIIKIKLVLSNSLTSTTVEQALLCSSTSFPNGTADD